jgi:hypothetical protein
VNDAILTVLTEEAKDEIHTNILQGASLINRAQHHVNVAYEWRAEGTDTVAFTPPTDAEALDAIDIAIEAAVNASHFLRHARRLLTGRPHPPEERVRMVETACRQACAQMKIDPDKLVDGEPNWKRYAEIMTNQFTTIEAATLTGQAAARLPELLSEED